MAYKDPEDQKRAARRHYEANRAQYIARAVAYNKKNRARVDEKIRELKSAPCTDCAQSYPFYVMQFDHLSDKLFTIARRSSGMSYRKVLTEIEKCEVVCSNCHAARTWQRRKKKKVVAGEGFEPPTSGL